MHVFSEASDFHSSVVHNSCIFKNAEDLCTVIGEFTEISRVSGKNLCGKWHHCGAQEQFPEGVLWKICFWKFRNIHRKAPVPKFLYKRSCSFGVFWSWKIYERLLPKAVDIEYDCHIISKYLVFQMKNLFQSKPLVVFVCCKCLDYCN